MRLVSVSLTFLIVVILGACTTQVDRRELAQEYFNLGNAYFELQDYERSYRYYRRAIDLSDTVPAAGFNLARLHLERGEHSEALAVLDSLLERDPTNTLVLETRAYALYRVGEVEAARRAYGDLLERSSRRRRVAYNLGLLEMDLQEYERAATVLSEYAGYAEDDEEYRWLLAEAYFLAGKEDRALTELEIFRSLVSDRPAMLASLAGRYVEWEYYLAALELFDVLPEDTLKEPDPAWAQARAFLLGSGEFDLGRAALERALQGGFDDTEALSELLNVLPDDEQEILREMIEEYDVGPSEEPA